MIRSDTALFLLFVRSFVRPHTHTYEHTRVCKPTILWRNRKRSDRSVLNMANLREHEKCTRTERFSVFVIETEREGAQRRKEFLLLLWHLISKIPWHEKWNGIQWYFFSSSTRNTTLSIRFAHYIMKATAANTLFYTRIANVYLCTSHRNTI